MPFIRDTGQLTHIGIMTGFVVFWVIALVLLFWEKPKPRAFLFFFFGVFLFVGFTVKEVWPFNGWRLWSRLHTKETTYYSLTITDAQGNIFGYDNDAAPPILPTQVNDLARRLLDPLYEKHAQPLATSLVNRANVYRLKLLAGKSSTPLFGLPAREFDIDWTAEQMLTCGPFTQIIARELRVDFGPTHESQPVFTILKERRFP